MKFLIVSTAILSFGTKSCEKVQCEEKVKTDCICTMQYDPVCGCNNVTYSNACEANCHGITTYVKGECNP